MKKYLTLNQVAEKLCIKIGSARNRLSRGDPMPPSVTVGRRRLFPEEDFQKWMDSFLRSNDSYLMESRSFPQGRSE